MATVLLGAAVLVLLGRVIYSSYELHQVRRDVDTTLIALARVEEAFGERLEQLEGSRNG
jgi:hypothetical protein